MIIGLLLVTQFRKLPSEKKSTLGYSGNLKVLMVSFMSRSGLDRMTTKKRAKRAPSSFTGATPLDVLFFFVCQADCHDLRFAFFMALQTLNLASTILS